MKNTASAPFANALMIAIVLMVCTMVLHPMGGSIEHIQQISTVLMATHALAILSVPFWILGLWGLTKQLEDDSLISLTAFIIMCIGMLAVVAAAALNGLALPLFVNHYLSATPEKLSAIKPVIVYNTSLNHAFDLVYTGASCLAVLLWSVAILKTRRLPALLAWLGILFSLLVLAALLTGFFFTDLSGFRVFVAGFAAWAIFIIIVLRRSTMQTN